MAWPKQKPLTDAGIWRGILAKDRTARCESVREGYRVSLTVGYDAAIAALKLEGFTEFAADQYLFEKG